MIALELFHGTTRSRAASIASTGFKVGSRRFDRWIASKGVYLVANRPSVAFHFAQRSVASNRGLMAERDEAAVLMVPIQWPSPSKVLDLTSDEGLRRLFDSCERIYGHLRTKTDEISGNSFRAQYKRDARSREEELEQLLSEALIQREGGLRVSWTTLAIDMLVEELRCSLVITAFQEGVSFDEAFGNKFPALSTAPEFQGFRVRDHIEVCVVDVSLIEEDKIEVFNFGPDDLADPFYQRVVIKGQPK